MKHLRFFETMERKGYAQPTEHLLYFDCAILLPSPTFTRAGEGHSGAVGGAGVRGNLARPGNAADLVDRPVQFLEQ